MIIQQEKFSLLINYKNVHGISIVTNGQILDMKDARVETALEMELLMERVPESIRFSKVSFSPLHEKLTFES